MELGIDLRFHSSASLNQMCLETGVQKISLLRELCKKTGKAIYIIYVLQIEL